MCVNPEQECELDIFYTGLTRRFVRKQRKGSVSLPVDARQLAEREERGNKWFSSELCLPGVSG